MKPVHPAMAECWSLQVGAVAVAQGLQHTTAISYSRPVSCKPLILPWQSSKDQLGVIAGENNMCFLRPEHCPTKSNQVQPSSSEVGVCHMAVSRPKCR